MQLHQEGPTIHSQVHNILRAIQEDATRSTIHALSYEWKKHPKPMSQNFWIPCAYIFVDSGTGSTLKYHDLLHRARYQAQRWKEVETKEFRWCAKGVQNRNIEGTTIFFFIIHHKLSPNKKSTYARFFVSYCTQKENPFNVRLTDGGNLFNYPCGFSTPTAGSIKIKTLHNCTISMSGAVFITININNFYLNMSTEIFEHIHIHLRGNPDIIIKQ